ncbi:hypothetical protein FDH82_gp16 [Roseobacter phage RDJL Phi 2]|uniref:Uncharacterized protein n=1 Tax=Roseobacter phage RDJL Phi 2 TaxID=1682380 RepID=A0A0K0PVF5_9CAUD|nr:hypothetical protein FDH82_gp16 [Roseobacter phage RDJL Phi 2]AKQ75806.1 hypothetical protein RDJLphi2_gp16 [Roseobacter phage RDJL Phi 2]
MTEIVDGVEWWHIYWVLGDTPRHAEHRNVVRSPPCSGWQHAVVVRGDKRSTIFCPFSMEAHTVPNGAGELTGAKEPRDPMPKARLIELIQNKWKECQSMGWSRDYDTAALVLRKLGGEVPVQTMKGGEEDTRKKGGKDTASKLLKPVKRSSKRGKFLEWFLEAGGSCSVREAMAEFGMSRSNALSYLYMIQKDHGIGYVLVGDIATVSLPDGCDNPFDAGPPPKMEKPEVEEEDDDSWLDGPAEEEDDDSWLE